jgi:hypothetical protein
VTKLKVSPAFSRAPTWQRSRMLSRRSSVGSGGSGLNRLNSSRNILAGFAPDKLAFLHDLQWLIEKI